MIAVGGRWLTALVAIGVLTGLLMGLLTGCAQKWPDTPRGRFMARCERCHGPDGSSEVATELAGRPVDLRSDRFQAEYSDLRLRTIMIEGEGLMQGISGIRDAEVDSILVEVRGFRSLRVDNPEFQIQDGFGDLPGGQ